MREKNYSNHHSVFTLNHYHLQLTTYTTATFHTPPTTFIMSSDGLQDAPSAEFQDDSYVSRPGEKEQPIPVQSDSDRVEDPIDGEQADTDAQLGMLNSVNLVQESL